MKLITTAETTTIDFEVATPRHCGQCQLCCKLLPNVQFKKPAGKPCQYQRYGKGCTIYQARPAECRLWGCRWLISPEETAGMPRPDRCHYVIDMLLDMGRIVNNETGEVEPFDCLQIWVDPAFPDAKDDPHLRAYMLRMATEHGWPTLLRWSTRVATSVWPPPLCADRQWHEETTECNENIGRFSKLPEDVREKII